MVNAAGGGGGGGGSAIDRCEPLFAEIADLLGQLAGNEICKKLLEAEANKPLEYPWTRVQSTFTIPGDYSFSLDWPLVTLQPASEEGMTSPVSDEDRRRELQSLIDSTWEKTRTHWSASDIPSQYRAASRQVWEPDPGPILRGYNQLVDVSHWLEQQSVDTTWTEGGDPGAPAWLTGLARHWPQTSQSSASFHAFWDDVNDKCALYLDAVRKLASTTGQTGAAIHDFQVNLVEVTEAARDRCKVALQQWQAFKDDEGAWPTGETRDSALAPAADILGGVSYLSGVAGLYPPASLVAGPVSVITGSLAYIAGIKEVVMEATTAATADELHQAFGSDLRTVADERHKALEAIRTRPPENDEELGAIPFADYVTTVSSGAVSSDWSVPEVYL